ncbi:MAG: hypothetical protein QMD32_03020 [Smithellaceae bacterium]|nr:hypothetical protein [Smithellaceae bacterium]
MDSRERKRIAAIWGAVAAYRAEEKGCQQEEELPSTGPLMMRPPNLWGLASRQDRMNQWYYWQMRPRR